LNGRRALLLCLLALAAAAAGCGGSGAVPVAAPAAAADVDALVAHVERVHPDPWHDVSRATFAAAAARLKERLPELGPDETLVELMRLVAQLGARDGHSGIFPLDPQHRRPLHLYPLRLFAFDDGLRVVGGDASLVGLRLLAIGGTPAERALAALRPVVPADNEWSRLAREAQWLVVAEVLHGLGVTESAGAAAFTFVRDDGVRVARTLAPVPAARWVAANGDLWHPMIPQGLPRRARPAFLARRNAPEWTARLDRGRAVYVAYNRTLGWSGELAGRVRRLARSPAVRGIVLDLRHNPGGENSAYAPLLDALVALARRERIVVLTSRTTFSAAANLLADLEARVRVTIVGEPSGGSPNLVGDPSPLRLEGTGWTVNVGTVWWQKSRRGPGDPRLAFEPDVRAPLRWADLAAGRDRALAAALRVATR
jgi:Peptidase family S41